MGRPPRSAPVSTAEELVPFKKEDGPFFIMHKTKERPIRVAQKGYAAVEPTTLSKVLEEVCEEYKDRIMFGIEWPEPPLDTTKTNPQEQVPPPLPLSQWKKWTYGQVLEDVKKVAKGYISLGHEPLETVSILGFNSPFWAIGAYAAIYAGGINTGMYATDSPEQIIYKVQNSETSIVLVDTEASYKKFVDHLEDMPTIRSIVVWKETGLIKSEKEGEEKMEVSRKDGTKITVLSWDQLLKEGENTGAEVDEALKKRVAEQKPGMCCTLVFTSGTTGNPKAVMISHDNIYFQLRVLENGMPPEIKNSGKVPIIVLSYLPLSHIAGFTVDVVAPVIAPKFKAKTECSIYFARSYDLKLGGILGRLLTVRPTVFFGVPRIWEKIAERLKAKAPKGGLTARLGAFAKRKMLSAERNEQIGHSGSKPFGYGFSKSLLKKVHAKLGLDRAIVTSSAAAPLKMETQEYWASLGIYISEAYGMSENCGIASVATKIHRQWGSVGYPTAGTEFKVFKVNPDDINDKKECPKAKSLDEVNEDNQGELCYRGRHIMLGYLANPKMGEEHEALLLKKNKDAIDDEGWLHSGDKGFITETGFVKVTGRYKELIIGAGGENIAPVPIEDDLKARCPAISNIMMIGDKRKYNTALVTLTCEGATGEKPGTDVLDGPAAEMTSAKTIGEACKDENFIKALEDKLKETNNNGKVIMNNTFKIQKFTILPADFSSETGELTPTLKLKRSVVEKKYEKAIEAMYSTEGVFVPYVA